MGRVGIGYEREIQYKSVIMKKLEIEKEASKAVSIADYSNSLSHEMTANEVAKSAEAEFFGRVSGEEEEPKEQNDSFFSCEDDELSEEYSQAAMPV